jgi:V/A-type H+-transporting ATPase subunit B
MPNDDISHPIPDTTGYITEGQLVLSRSLHKKGIYPPFEVLASISRLMKDAIGKENTREDHADVSSQLLASYSSYLEVKDLISIVGEDGLNNNQRNLLKFGMDFEQRFLNQKLNENREIIDSLDIAWETLSNLDENQLIRIHSEFINKYYKKRV